jgi:LCP family protein required for cell wall assembly
LLNEFGDKRSDDSDDLGLAQEDSLLDEAIEEPPKKSQKDKKGKKRKDGKPKKKHKVRRRILITLFLLLVVAGVVFFIWGDSIIARLTNGNSGLWNVIGSMMSETVPFETDEHGRTNVLVFGTEGYNMNGDVGNTQHEGADLTDSIMVISFDQETKDVALLSIPRDLKVSQACFAGKVNEVYTCNNADGADETAGAEALEEQLGEVLGIDFQYWAHVNWGSLVQIIDALGGITVTLDEDIADYWNTGVVMQAGVPAQVDGETALGITRARYGTQGGDFTRGNSQQKIVEGIVQKMIDNGVGLTEAFNLLNILGDNLRTNFSSDNIKAGLSLMAGFNPADIRNVSLVDYDNNIYYVKTAEIGGISYVIPDLGAGMYREIHAYVDKMFSSNPAVREGATIAIYNATETPGVAGAEQTRLEDEGYTISEIDDAAIGDCAEKYCVFVLDEAMSATKAALEERYGISAQSAAELPGDIYPGDASIVIVIGAAE